MTSITQTQTKSPAVLIAGVALAAAVVGGIVGTSVQTILDGAAPQSPALSAHDLAVLKSAQEWEARYREMYPNSR
jgi:hypothetical protein